MPTPKHIRAFELRLRANWSSEDVVPMLTPDFLETVLLHGFAALEPTIKVRQDTSPAEREWFSSAVVCYVLLQHLAIASVLQFVGDVRYPSLCLHPAGQIVLASS